jgi:hypothetical protein
MIRSAADEIFRSDEIPEEILRRGSNDKSVVQKIDEGFLKLENV